MVSEQGSRAPETNRVLLVEDESALLQVTARVLSAEGRQVVQAASGDEAVQKLASVRFDAVVSDVRMPGMTGIQLLRAVRDHDPDVQVVLITGQPNVGTATSAIEYGAFQYLVKPVEPEHLRRVIALAIDATHTARIRREFAESFESGAFRVGDAAHADAALDRALGSLWIAYQPIVRASSLEPFGYEALLRNEEPSLANPVDALDAALRANRLRAFGHAIRAKVAADLRGSLSTQTVFVNLHADDLSDPALCSPAAPLSAHAPRVVLEISERHSLHRLSDASERFGALRELGYRLALDDVGGGYAGLSSFALLAPDFVKLDVSLVRELHQSALKRRLVGAIVGLCHDTDKQVIAEGVETSGEQEALEALGCDLLQGFSFGRPEREPLVPRASSV